MSQATTQHDVSELVADLEQAAEARERATERVAEIGEAELDRLADAYRDLQSLFDTYEERATGDGDFQVFIEFQEEMAKFIERLDEDVRHYECFEEVDDLMQQRRLTESDFAKARDTLAPVENDVARLEERDATANRFDELTTRAHRRRRELEERIGELDRLLELDDADLDAPVERLRDPIESYDDAVSDAFREFKRDAPAREVLSFVASTTAFPLIDYSEPPEDLRSYVERHDPGTEPIPQLLEYADYSKSKLDHYVDDADHLTRQISTHRTYLRRLDATPLTIGWPPPSASRLQWELRERIQVVGRFAPEAVVAQLRDLRSLPDEVDYGRLHRSAMAREQLTDEQRRRLADGAVEREREQAATARDRLAETLAELDG
jgi:hypothetical protein